MAMSLCSVEGCGRQMLAQGLCSRHYQESRAHGTFRPVEKVARFCEVKGCDKKHYAHGLCQMHGTRMKVRGTVEDRPITGTYIATIVDGDRREWEHREIAERVLGKKLPPQAHVHHFDGNGRNNANRNLVICQDAAYHKLLHRRQRIRDLGGDPNTQSWCSMCKSIRSIDLFWTRKSGDGKGRLTSCCKICGGHKSRSTEASL